MEIKRIRKTHKNINILKSLDKVCFPGDDSFPFGLRKYDCWMCFLDGEIIGYASACKMKDKYFLARAGVMPEHRGKGVQKKFIKARIGRANMLQLDSIVTYTTPVNLPSILSLESYGFDTWNDVCKSFYDDSFLYWKLDL